MAIRSIGVLTGGGDCPGLNAVLRAIVKTAHNEHQLRIIGIHDGFEGLIEADRTRPLDVEAVRGILPRGGTILGASSRTNPFAVERRAGARLEKVDMSDEVLKRIRELGIDALMVIGGDGTLKIALDLAARGLRVVGIPKTIDNDIDATDLSFGFDSAVVTATEAIDKLHTTAESHHRVMVVEVMGRYAGWIALVAGLAGGADVILIPELPYDLDSVVAKVEARAAAGRLFSIIVVAEGAHSEAETYAYTDQPGGEQRLRGAGDRVARAVAERTGRPARNTILGHIQRGGSPSPFDRILATRFGAHAVKLAAQGRFGTMVALQGWRTTAVPIAKAVARLKTVPIGGQLVRTACSLGISFGRPLRTNGELNPVSKVP